MQLKEKGGKIKEKDEKIIKEPRAGLKEEGKRVKVVEVVKHEQRCWCF